MLETRAEVLKVNGKEALVRASQADGCEQCNGKGCGAGKLSRMFCSKPRDFQVENSVNATVGDQVIVSVADGAVLHGIWWVYLLPLMLLIAGALTGHLMAGESKFQDMSSTGGAILGLVAGFFLIRRIFARQVRGRRFQPYISSIWREQ